MKSRPGFRRAEESNLLRRITADAVLSYSYSNELCISVPYGATSQNVYRLRSRECKLWLRSRFEAESGRVPTESQLRSAIDQIEARAVFGELPLKPLGPRCLTYDGRIVVDLANSSGQCVEITATGWKATDGLAHAFTRHSGTASLPEPQTPEHDTFEQFRSLLSIPSGNDWARILTFLTAAVTGLGPCPVLVLQGPSGSTKTSTARMLQAAIDPAAGVPPPLPASAAALRKQAAGQRVLVFDDVHRIGSAQASEIARLADDEAQPHAIILVRACSSSAILPEQLERRALTVTLQQPQTLRTLRALRREFERLHPMLLGALCDAVSETLRRLHEAAEPVTSRLADTTLIALAAAPALHLETNRILSAIAECGPGLVGPTPPVGARPPGRARTPLNLTRLGY